MVCSRFPASRVVLTLLFACLLPRLVLAQDGFVCCPPGSDGSSNCGGCPICIDNTPCILEPPMTEPECPNPNQGKFDGWSDPLNLWTGDYTTSIVDLSVPSRDFNIELRRTFRGDGGPSRQRAMPHHLANYPLGFGWDHSYNIFIVREAATTRLLGTNGAITTVSTAVKLNLWLGNGTFARFTWNTATNRFESPTHPGFITLAFNTTYQLETATLWMPDRSYWVFNPFRYAPPEGSSDPIPAEPNAGKIAEIHKPSGAWLVFSYDTAGLGRLEQVSDDLNRGLSFTYKSYLNSFSEVGSYVWVIDTVQVIGDDRTVRYDYAYQNCPSSCFYHVLGLTSAKLPAGTSTTDGRTWHYAYDSSFSLSPRWLLTTVTDPNGQVVTQNTYGTNPYRRGSDKAAVIGQTYAGQYFDYAWSTVSSTDDHLKVTIANRANQKKELIYDATFSPGSQPSGDTVTGRFLVTREREYTGLVTSRSNPSFPVGAKLRPGSGSSSDPDFVPADPDYFETTYTYDDQDRITSTRYPKGNGVKIKYEPREPGENPNDPPKPQDPRRRWNVAERRQMTDVSAQESTNDVVESWTYGPYSSTGCGCGSAKSVTHTDARGNTTQFGYDDAGNVISTSYPPVTAGLYSGTVQYASEATDYGTGNGDSQGAYPDQVKAVYHDSNGTTAPVDRYYYYTSGSMTGRLQTVVADAGGKNLSTSYTYDAVGNVTSVTDPLGRVTLYAYDLANNLIIEQAPALTINNTQVRFQTNYYYDKNNNLIRKDVQDYGGPADGLVTSIYSYDTLNRPLLTVREVGAVSISASIKSPTDLVSMSGYNTADFSVTERQYDATGKASSIVVGTIAAIAEGEEQPLFPVPPTVTPLTQTTYQYDERSLLFRKTEGLDGESLTTQYNYDINGNMVSTIAGWGLGSAARRTDWEYDLFDRVTKAKDASSTDITKRTRWEYVYDKAGNATNITVYGRLDVTDQNLSAIELSDTSYQFDERNRRYAESRSLFDLAAGTPISSSVTLTFRNPDNTVKAQRDPNGYDTQWVRDSAGRLWKTVDAKGNIVENTYDDAGNLTMRKSREKSDVANEPDQIFTVTYDYDVLDRLKSQTDGVGNVTSYGYDSRNNHTSQTSPRGGTTNWTYDGMGRELSMSIAASNTLTITTQKQWDAASRIVAQIDGNNNATRYALDSRSRLYSTRLADGTFDQVGTGLAWSGTPPMPSLSGFAPGYNAFGDRLKNKDANGTVVDVVFDKMGRLLSRSVTFASGSSVSNDTTWEYFRYDGVGRLTAAADNDSFDAFVYDSLGRLTSERQHLLARMANVPATDPDANESSARVVTYAGYDADGHVTDLVYPVGTWDTITGATVPYPLRRHVGYTYDALGRTSTIVEKSDPTVSSSPSIAAFGYYGPASGGRERYRAYGNGTRADRVYSGFTTDQSSTPYNTSGSYAFGRPLQISHTKPGQGGSTGVNIATFNYAWDRDQNKTSSAFSADKTSGTYSDSTIYGYDNAERLTSSTRIGGNWAKATTYTLDAVHNRTKINEGAADQNYWMNSASSPADAQVNQYTRTPTDELKYDLAGNLSETDLGCIGDLNGDRSINTADLVLLVAAYGTSNALTDLNSDGTVNTADLTVLLSRFGRACDYEIATWDYANRLVAYVGTTTGSGTPGTSAGTKSHAYRYDALGRRIAKTLDAGQSYQRSERFVWGGQSVWQMLVHEVVPGSTEGSPTVTSVTTFVYQPAAGYVDDVIAMRRDVDGPSIPAAGEIPASGTVAATRNWYHADDLFTVVAMTDASGAVAERQHFDDYGTPRLLGADFAVLSAGTNGRIESIVGNPHGFTGRESDAENALYQYRHRFFSSGSGQFVSRDPLGLFGDAANIGNSKAYVGDRPTQWLDGYGLQTGSPDSLTNAIAKCHEGPKALLIECLKTAYFAFCQKNAPAECAALQRTIDFLQWLEKNGIKPEIEEQHLTDNDKKFIEDAQDRNATGRRCDATHDGKPYKDEHNELPPGKYKEYYPRPNKDYPDSPLDGRKNPQRCVIDEDGRCYFTPQHPAPAKPGQPAPQTPWIPVAPKKP